MPILSDASSGRKRARLENVNDGGHISGAYTASGPYKEIADRSCGLYGDGWERARGRRKREKRSGRDILLGMLE